MTSMFLVAAFSDWLLQTELAKQTERQLMSETIANRSPKYYENSGKPKKKNTFKKNNKQTIIFKESWLGPPLPESLRIFFVF